MFFELCVSFCVQPCLQLEMVGKSSPHRRAKIIDKYVNLKSTVLSEVSDSYGDMRITMNTSMLAKWKILSHVHSEFVPDIVGPFLKVSLISEPGESHTHARTHTHARAHMRVHTCTHAHALTQ